MATLPEQDHETIKSFKQTINAAVLMSVRQRASRPVIRWPSITISTVFVWNCLPNVHQLTTWLGR